MGLDPRVTDVQYGQVQHGNVVTWILSGRNITKNCPCNVQRIFSEAKIENFLGKMLIFLIFELKTITVGTCQKRVIYILDQK